MAHDLSAESNECADRLRSQPQAPGPGGEVKAHGRRAAAKMDVRVRLSAELVSLPLAGAVETSSKMTGGGEDARRTFCPELSRPSAHAARADGVRSGSAASSSRRMIEDIVALNRNARCPPRATSTFLRCAPWCVSNRHEDGGQKGSCRE